MEERDSRSGRGQAPPLRREETTPDADPAPPEVVPYRGISRLEDWPELTSSQAERWDRYLAKLQRIRDESGEHFAAAREAAFRAAALDSGALEGLVDTDPGFTMTVATQAAAWQQMMDERGEGQRATFEDQLRAFELVLDLATERRPVTESFVRQLHEVACASQATHPVWTTVGWQERDLVKGRYKEHPNNPKTPSGTIHSYAPPDETAREMASLVEILRSHAFASVHPLVQAAFAHHSLAVIHPFADGNGRVARALGSVYVVRAASVPLVIFADQRTLYLTGLHQADDGRFDPLIEFNVERFIDTVNLLGDVLVSGEPRLAVERLRKIFDNPADLSRSEVDDAAHRVLLEVRRAVGASFRALEVPSEVICSATEEATDDMTPPAGTRRIDARPSRGRGRLTIRLETEHPAAAANNFTLRTLVMLDAAAPFPICIKSQPERYDLKVRISEAHPRIAASLRLRVEYFVKRVLNDRLSDLADRAEKAFEKNR